MNTGDIIRFRGLDRLISNRNRLGVVSRIIENPFAGRSIFIKFFNEHCCKEYGPFFEFEVAKIEQEKENDE